MEDTTPERAEPAGAVQGAAEGGSPGFPGIPFTYSDTVRVGLKTAPLKMPLGQEGFVVMGGSPYFRKHTEVPVG